MIKYKFLRGGLFFLIIILLISPGFSTAKPILFLQPEIIVGPYTQNVNDTSITIVWETNTPTVNNSVEYGENTSYGYIEYGLSDCYHHEITINPSFLSGNYKVVSDDVESDDFEFKLASYCYNTQEFKCVIFGDSRGVWDGWIHATEVADAVNAELPDFTIHGGDMVNDGTVETQWVSWLELMRPLMQNSTVFGVLGNHEHNGRRYYEIFALPNNEMWYSFDYGPCHFTILDNYESWSVDSSQYNWLENDLFLTDKPFRIVCFHEPIYCSGGHQPRTDVRAVWEPLFIKYNVDLVFQSHCHYYQRSDPINEVTYIVTGGAGAPLYTPKDAWFVNNSKEAYHYCVLDVSLATMEIKFSAKSVDGVIFDEFVVYPSTAPYAPNIAGPTIGHAGGEYDYTFDTTDPDGDDVYYWIEWGDGQKEEWIGPYPSGEEIRLNHTWSNRGIYPIEAKAKDINGEESNWGTLRVSMPKNKPYINTPFMQFFEKLIQRFPPITRLLQLPVFEKLTNLR